MPFAEIRVNPERVIQWEVSQKEEKKKSYINTCMWNLGKCYRWTYLQSRNKDTNTPTPRRGKRRWDELGDWDWHVDATMYKITNRNLPHGPGNSTCGSVVTKREYTFTYSWFTLLYRGTNTTVQRTCTPIKLSLKRRVRGGEKQRCRVEKRGSLWSMRQNPPGRSTVFLWKPREEKREKVETFD